MFEEYPQAAGFVQAIRAEPDDATHRLVFADWLDERGDPRAAWLRDADLWPWMAPDCHDPVPPLLATLLADDWQERSRAGDALKRLGMAAIVAVRAWVSEEPDRRYWEARWVLEASPPPALRPVEELIATLPTADPFACWLAVIDLGFHGPAAAPAVPALCQVETYHGEFWGHGDHHDLDEAILGVLEKLGPLAVGAITYLYDKLDARANVREAAWSALEKVGRHDPDAMLRHVRRLDSDSNEHGALRLLAHVHPEGMAVLARVLRGEVSLYNAPAMVGCVISGEPYSSPAELTDAEAAILVPALIEALGRPYSTHEVNFNLGCLADALAVIGEPARVAVPALREALAGLGDYDYAREHLALALARLGDAATGLAALIPGLRDPREFVRGAAVGQVAAMAASAPEAIPVLLDALGDPAAFVRERAAQAFADLADPSSDPAVFVPPLLAALADSSAEVRQYAVAALGAMKGKRKGDFLSRLVMPGLFDGNGDAFDRTELVDLEGRIVAALLARLADPDEVVRDQAVEALHRWDDLPAEGVEPLLAIAETHPNDRVRGQALDALRSVSEYPEAIVPRVIALFGAADDVAGKAADLLTKIGAAAVPALIAMLGQPNDRIAGYAIRALDDMGPPAVAAVPHLLPFTASPDPGRRAFVVEILGQMQAPEQTLPTLRQALADPAADVRRNAVYALAHTGPAAAAAIPDLLRCTADPDDRVRHAAVFAVGKLGADPADRLRVYLAALADLDGYNRSQALDGLAELGRGDSAVFAQVTAHCQDAYDSARSSAIKAVAALAPTPADAILHVRALLDDPEEDVRSSAVEAFLSLGDAAADVAPDLYARFGGRGEGLSPVFVRAIRTLSNRALEALVPQWREELASEEEEDRQAAAKALRACGPLGDAALRGALADADEDVRAAAEYGLSLDLGEPGA